MFRQAVARENARSGLRCQDPRPSRAPLVIAGFGLVAAGAWSFVTIVETDGGWEDAIWRYSSASKTMAVIATTVGAVAAISAFIAACRLRSRHGDRSRTWLLGSIATEVILFAAWIVLLYTAPS